MTLGLIRCYDSFRNQIGGIENELSPSVMMCQRRQTPPQRSLPKSSSPKERLLLRLLLSQSYSGCYFYWLDERERSVQLALYCSRFTFATLGEYANPERFLISPEKRMLRCSW